MGVVMYYDKREINKKNILGLIDGSLIINSNNKLIDKNRVRYNIRILIETYDNFSTSNIGYEYLEIITCDYKEQFSNIIKMAVELRIVVPKNYRVVVYDTPDMTFRYETERVLTLEYGVVPNINAEFFVNNYHNILLTQIDISNIITSILIK